jgi:hypothetical protein
MVQQTTAGVRTTRRQRTTCLAVAAQVMDVVMQNLQEVSFGLFKPALHISTYSNILCAQGHQLHQERCKSVFSHGLMLLHTA